MNSLFQRGLDGTTVKLVTIDGNKGLANAAEVFYPNARIQRCWAHKLRNATNHVPRKLQLTFSAEASRIYKANSKSDAVLAFKELKQIWTPIAPKAISVIEDDLDSLLSFFRCPAPLWIKLRTTNMIERVFREVRRRTRTMSTFNNLASLERIIFAIFHRQNTIWSKKPLKI